MVLVGLDVSYDSALLKLPLKKVVDKNGTAVNVQPYEKFGGVPVYIWTARGDTTSEAAILEINVLYGNEAVPPGFRKIDRDLSHGSCEHPSYLIYRMGSPSIDARPINDIMLIGPNATPDYGYELIQRPLFEEGEQFRLAVKYGSEDLFQMNAADLQWVENLKEGDSVDALAVDKQWRVAKILNVFPDRKSVLVAFKGWGSSYNTEIPQNTKRLARLGMRTAGKDTRKTTDQGSAFSVSMDVLEILEKKIDLIISDSSDFPEDERDSFCKGELPGYVLEVMSSRYDSATSVETAQGVITYSAEELRQRINDFNCKVITLCSEHIGNFSEPIPPEVLQHIERYFLLDLRCNYFYEQYDSMSRTNPQASQYEDKFAQFPLSGANASKHWVRNVNHFCRIGGVQKAIDRLNYLTAASVQTREFPPFCNGSSTQSGCHPYFSPQIRALIGTPVVSAIIESNLHNSIDAGRELLTLVKAICMGKWVFSLEWGLHFFAQFRDAVLWRLLSLSEQQLRALGPRDVDSMVTNVRDTLNEQRKRPLSSLPQHLSSTLSSNPGGITAESLVARITTNMQLGAQPEDPFLPFNRFLYEHWCRYVRFQSLAARVQGLSGLTHLLAESKNLFDAGTNANSAPAACVLSFPTACQLLSARQTLDVVLGGPVRVCGPPSAGMATTEGEEVRYQVNAHLLQALCAPRGLLDMLAEADEALNPSPQNHESIGKSSSPSSSAAPQQHVLLRHVDLMWSILEEEIDSPASPDMLDLLGRLAMRLPVSHLHEICRVLSSVFWMVSVDSEASSNASSVPLVENGANLSGGGASMNTTLTAGGKGSAGPGSAAAGPQIAKVAVKTLCSILSGRASIADISGPDQSTKAARVGLVSDMDETMRLEGLQRQPLSSEAEKANAPFSLPFALFPHLWRIPGLLPLWAMAMDATGSTLPTAALKGKYPLKASSERISLLDAMESTIHTKNGKRNPTSLKMRADFISMAQDSLVSICGSSSLAGSGLAQQLAVCIVDLLGKELQGSAPLQLLLKLLSQVYVIAPAPNQNVSSSIGSTATSGTVPTGPVSSGSGGNGGNGGGINFLNRMSNLFSSSSTSTPTNQGSSTNVLNSTSSSNSVSTNDRNSSPSVDVTHLSSSYISTLSVDQLCLLLRRQMHVVELILHDIDSLKMEFLREITPLIMRQYNASPTFSNPLSLTSSSSFVSPGSSGPIPGRSGLNSQKEAFHLIAHLMDELQRAILIRINCLTICLSASDDIDVLHTVEMLWLSLVGSTSTSELISIIHSNASPGNTDVSMGKSMNRSSIRAVRQLSRRLPELLFAWLYERVLPRLRSYRPLRHLTSNIVSLPSLLSLKSIEKLLNFFMESDDEYHLGRVPVSRLGPSAFQAIYSLIVMTASTSYAAPAGSLSVSSGGLPSTTTPSSTTTNVANSQAPVTSTKGVLKRSKLSSLFSTHSNNPSNASTTSSTHLTPSHEGSRGNSVEEAEQEYDVSAAAEGAKEAEWTLEEGSTLSPALILRLRESTPYVRDFRRIRGIPLLWSMVLQENAAVSSMALQALVTLTVNLDMPDANEFYLNRTGRSKGFSPENASSFENAKNSDESKDDMTDSPAMSPVQSSCGIQIVDAVSAAEMPERLFQRVFRTSKNSADSAKFLEFSWLDLTLPHSSPSLKRSGRVVITRREVWCNFVTIVNSILEALRSNTAHADPSRGLVVTLDHVQILRINPHTHAGSPLHSRAEMAVGDSVSPAGTNSTTANSSPGVDMDDTNSKVNQAISQGLHSFEEKRKSTGQLDSSSKAPSLNLHPLNSHDASTANDTPRQRGFGHMRARTVIRLICAQRSLLDALKRAKEIAQDFSAEQLPPLEGSKYPFNRGILYQPPPLPPHWYAVLQRHEGSYNTHNVPNTSSTPSSSNVPSFRDKYIELAFFLRVPDNSTSASGSNSANPLFGSPPSTANSSITNSNVKVHEIVVLMHKGLDCLNDVRDRVAQLFGLEAEAASLRMFRVGKSGPVNLLDSQMADLLEVQIRVGMELSTGASSGIGSSRKGYTPAALRLDEVMVRMSKFLGKPTEEVHAEFLRFQKAHLQEFDIIPELLADNARAREVLMDFAASSMPSSTPKTKIHGAISRDDSHYGEQEVAAAASREISQLPLPSNQRQFLLSMGDLSFSIASHLSSLDHLVVGSDSGVDKSTYSKDQRFWNRFFGPLPQSRLPLFEWILDHMNAIGQAEALDRTLRLDGAAPTPEEKIIIDDMKNGSLSPWAISFVRNGGLQFVSECVKTASSSARSVVSPRLGKHNSSGGSNGELKGDPVGRRYLLVLLKLYTAFLASSSGFLKVYTGCSVYTMMLSDSNSKSSTNESNRNNGSMASSVPSNRSSKVIQPLLLASFDSQDISLPTANRAAGSSSIHHNSASQTDEPDKKKRRGEHEVFTSSVSGTSNFGSTFTTHSSLNNSPSSNGTPGTDSGSKSIKNRHGIVDEELVFVPKTLELAALSVPLLAAVADMSLDNNFNSLDEEILSGLPKDNHLGNEVDDSVESEDESTSKHLISSKKESSSKSADSEEFAYTTPATKSDGLENTSASINGSNGGNNGEISGFMEADDESEVPISDFSIVNIFRIAPLSSPSTADATANTGNSTLSKQNLSNQLLDCVFRLVAASLRSASKDFFTAALLKSPSISLARSLHSFQLSDSNTASNSHEIANGDFLGASSTFGLPAVSTDSRTEPSSVSVFVGTPGAASAVLLALCASGHAQTRYSILQGLLDLVDHLGHLTHSSPSSNDSSALSQKRGADLQLVWEDFLLQTALQNLSVIYSFPESANVLFYLIKRIILRRCGRDTTAIDRAVAALSGSLFHSQRDSVSSSTKRRGEDFQDNSADDSAEDPIAVGPSDLVPYVPPAASADPANVQNNSSVPSVRFSPKVNRRNLLCFDELDVISNVVTLIRHHPIVETSADDNSPEDIVLAGLFGLLSCLLDEFPEYIRVVCAPASVTVPVSIKYSEGSSSDPTKEMKDGEDGDEREISVRGMDLLRSLYHDILFATPSPEPIPGTPILPLHRINCDESFGHSQSNTSNSSDMDPLIVDSSTFTADGIPHSLEAFVSYSNAELSRLDRPLSGSSNSTVSNTSSGKTPVPIGFESRNAVVPTFSVFGAPLPKAKTADTRSAALSLLNKLVSSQGRENGKVDDLSSVDNALDLLLLLLPHVDPRFPLGGQKDKLDSLAEELLTPSQSSGQEHGESARLIALNLLDPATPYLRSDDALEDEEEDGLRVSPLISSLRTSEYNLFGLFDAATIFDCHTGSIRNYFENAGSVAASGQCEPSSSASPLAALRNSLISLDTTAPGDLEAYFVTNANSFYLPFPTVHSTQGRNATEYAGLKNPGCICYMNSSLQQFFMNPQFRRRIFSFGVPPALELPKLSTSSTSRAAQAHALDAIRQERADSILLCLEELFAKMQDCPKVAINPINLTRAIKDWDGNPTELMEQKDVPEFLTKLFSDVETQNQGTKFAQIARDIFGGTVTQELVATSPSLPLHASPFNLYTAREEEFLYLQVSVKGMGNLQNALRHYINGETVDYKWSLPGGAQREETLKTQKRVSLSNLGDNLMLFLNRFDFDLQRMEQVKLNDRFEFPVTLDMYPYTIHGRPDRLDPESMSSTTSPTVVTQNTNGTPSENLDDYIYELVGIVIHLGTAKGGHYYSYIRERSATGPAPGDRWLEFNDHLVSPWSLDQLDEDAFGGSPCDSPLYSKNPSASSGGNLNGMGVSFQADSVRVANAFCLFYERRHHKNTPTPLNCLGNVNSNSSINMLGNTAGSAGAMEIDQVTHSRRSLMSTTEPHPLTAADKLLYPALPTSSALHRSDRRVLRRLHREFAKFRPSSSTPINNNTTTSDSTNLNVSPNTNLNLNGHANKNLCVLPPVGVLRASFAARLRSLRPEAVNVTRRSARAQLHASVEGPLFASSTHIHTSQYVQNAAYSRLFGCLCEVICRRLNAMKSGDTVAQSQLLKLLEGLRRPLMQQFPYYLPTGATGAGASTEGFVAATIDQLFNAVQQAPGERLSALRGLDGEQEGLGSLLVRLTCFFLLYSADDSLYHSDDPPVCPFTASPSLYFDLSAPVLTSSVAGTGAGTGSSSNENVYYHVRNLLLCVVSVSPSAAATFLSLCLARKDHFCAAVLRMEDSWKADLFARGTAVAVTTLWRCIYSNLTASQTSRLISKYLSLLHSTISTLLTALSVSPSHPTGMSICVLPLLTLVSTHHIPQSQFHYGLYQLEPTGMESLKRKMAPAIIVPILNGYRAIEACCKALANAPTRLRKDSGATAPYPLHFLEEFIFPLKYRHMYDLPPDGKPIYPSQRYPLRARGVADFLSTLLSYKLPLDLSVLLAREGLQWNVPVSSTSSISSEPFFHGPPSGVLDCFLSRLSESDESENPIEAPLEDDWLQLMSSSVLDGHPFGSIVDLESALLGVPTSKSAEWTPVQPVHAADPSNHNNDNSSYNLSLNPTFFHYPQNLGDPLSVASGSTARTLFVLSRARRALSLAVDPAYRAPPGVTGEFAKRKCIAELYRIFSLGHSFMTPLSPPEAALLNSPRFLLNTLVRGLQYTGKDRPVMLSACVLRALPFHACVPALDFVSLSAPHPLTVTESAARKHSTSAWATLSTPFHEKDSLKMACMRVACAVKMSGELGLQNTDQHSLENAYSTCLQLVEPLPLRPMVPTIETSDNTGNAEITYDLSKSIIFDRFPLADGPTDPDASSARADSSKSKELMIDSIKVDLTPDPVMNIVYALCIASPTLEYRQYEGAFSLLLAFLSVVPAIPSAASDSDPSINVVRTSKKAEWTTALRAGGVASTVLLLAQACVHGGDPKRAVFLLSNLLLLAYHCEPVRLWLSQLEHRASSTPSLRDDKVDEDQIDEAVEADRFVLSSIEFTLRRLKEMKFSSALERRLVNVIQSKDPLPLVPADIEWLLNASPEARNINSLNSGSTGNPGFGLYNQSLFTLSTGAIRKEIDRRATNSDELNPQTRVDINNPIHNRHIVAAGSNSSSASMNSLDSHSNFRNNPNLSGVPRDINADIEMMIGEDDIPNIDDLD